MKLNEWQERVCHYFKILNNFKNYPSRFLIAGGIIILLCYILFSKMTPPTKEDASPHKIPKVEVIESQQQAVKPLLRLSAETKANRIITIRAEIAGKIVEILEEKGQNIKISQSLLKIIDNDQVARLAHAQASVAHRQAEYQAATKLKSKNFMAENSYLESKAKLEAANAELKKAKYECDQLTVKSPLNGYYENCCVEIGDYVEIGDKLVTIADLSLLKLNVYISEKDILSIKEGQEAVVKIDNYKNPFKAKVKYISRVADPKTRTFLVELNMDNSQFDLFDGLTAKVILTRDEEYLHVLPPSALTLSDQGEIGVMIVENNTQAVFKPVEVLQAEGEAVYLKGLPANITLITVGGEFVKAGQTVEPIFSKSQVAPS